MSRAVDASKHRRLSRAKRALERSGVRRVPGYPRLALRLRSRVFPALTDETDFVSIRIDGLTLEVPRRLLPHYLHRAYEPLAVRAFRAALRPEGVAVDVGAHIGYYTCLAARAVGPRGLVHALEPSRDNAEVVRGNLARNGLTNACLHELAAAEFPGSRTLQLTQASDNHGLYGHPISPTVATTTVRARPVDELVDGPVQVIKIDVEGAEPEVLRGMRRLLRSSKGATVLVEWNPKAQRHAGTRPEELPDLLSELGVANLTVLDDGVGDVLNVTDVRRALAQGAMPHEWYANLRGTVREE